jgi:hypothetical protein
VTQSDCEPNVTWCSGIAGYNFFEISQALLDVVFAKLNYGFGHHVQGVIAMAVLQVLGQQVCLLELALSDVVKTLVQAGVYVELVGVVDELDSSAVVVHFQVWLGFQFKQVQFVRRIDVQRVASLLLVVGIIVFNELGVTI